VTPPPPIGVPAGASADGHSIPLPEALGPSPLERLLARGRLRSTLAMLGPAFVASVAYVDPGNFATNLQGGARYGYLLLWVVLLANLMAMLVQYLSAKLGIVTDRNLPELCRERFARRDGLANWRERVVGDVRCQERGVEGGHRKEQGRAVACHQSGDERRRRRGGRLEDRA